MKIFQSFCALILIVLAQISWAGASLEGKVHRLNGELILTMAEDGREFRLFTRNSYVMTDLQKLEDGDYLSGTGWIHENSSAVEVTAVEFVGLSKMLGLWHTSDWRVFDFKNFSQLDLYLPTKSKALNALHLRSLRYTVAPDGGTDWSILIVDSNSVDVGNLFVRKDSMRIEVFDPKTGNVATTIDLSPLNW